MRLFIRRTKDARTDQALELYSSIAASSLFIFIDLLLIDLWLSLIISSHAGIGFKMSFFSLYAFFTLMYFCIHGLFKCYVKHRC
ncbi:hypothetical protein [Falsibacillus pallidus]|uniref:hypothetical protein n=1 Tax=Falsibacillus pallidus TaxID=493781 RepID=UPI003D9985A2